MATMIKEIALSSGLTVKVAPIAPLERDLVLNSIPYPEPPYGEVETITGAMERFARRDDPQYLAACKQVDRERQEKFARFILLGIDVEMPADEAWATRLQAVGVIVPTDTVERQLMYLQSQVIRTADDLMQVMTAAMSNVATEGEIKAAQATFRREVAGAPVAAVGRAGGTS